MYCIFLVLFLQIVGTVRTVRSMLVFHSEHCRWDTGDGLPQWPHYPSNGYAYSIHYDDLPVSVLLSLALVRALTLVSYG